LVKGLDYALLNQQRQKLESGGSDGGGGSGPAAAQNAAAAAAAAAVAEATAAAAKASVKFSTPLGRSVYHAVFRPVGGNRNLVREMFQPRRTAFVFEFGEGGSDVPTTLRRSKADCPAVQVGLCWFGWTRGDWVLAHSDEVVCCMGHGSGSVVVSVQHMSALATCLQRLTF
jgi:hypothetical protein